MRRVPVWLLALAACDGGGGDPSPDAGPGSDSGTVIYWDAAPPGEQFDHFSFALEPAVPLVNRDVTLVVTAHDESSILDLDGTVSVSASIEGLSGETSAVELSGGVAELTLSFDTAAEDVTLTVTEDSDPDITGTTEPFRVSPPGDTAGELDVVINEVNWYGNGDDPRDEWIELRNASGGELNLSEWTIENAASSGAAPVQLGNGTIVDDGAYVLIGRQQGADEAGERTSLTGVEGAQLHSLELSNAGEALILRDPAGTVIDATPEGGWPAGNAEHTLSMERRDDLTGGGYGSGAEASSWYTWSSIDGADTTSADTADAGTPGADNTDPDIVDHLTIVVNPNPPVAGLDFSMTVTAYSSADDSDVIDSYDGTVSVSASSGTLTGDIDAHPITAGTAGLTLQNDTPAESVLLTVQDDIYASITGTIDVKIRPEGDIAGQRDVVINELNWYGNGNDSSDEWIELRNVSGGELNLAGWVIDRAGTSDGAVTLDSGTVLADGDYLVVGRRQGPDVDGERTSLTGVPGVQTQTVNLTNSGEALDLRDVNGNLIDATPAPPPAGDWPAGDDDELMSMERFDDVTGGGYGDGTQASSWYTWNQFDGTDTTHPETADRGTPGADNSDPSPPPQYASSFEAGDPGNPDDPGDPAWENTTTGGFSNDPPTGTTPRTGAAVITTGSVTTVLGDREVRSVDCLALSSVSAPLGVEIFAMASTENGGNQLKGRLRVLFYDSADCVGEIASLGPTVSTPLPQGSYEEISAVVDPPAGATHFKLWFQVADDNGTPNDGDAWAADDVAVFQ